MWTRVASLLVAAAAASGVVRADEYFTGDMTTYTLGQPSAGNCNFMNAPADAATDYAAINNPQWAGTKNCGRCAHVSCADSRCSDTTKTKLVYILDQCPECKQGDLDVSPTVFKELTGSDPSRYKIKWKFVDCPVAGNIKYCLKAGSNPFWTAIQPANIATGVAGMTINSQTTSMVPSAYYYLLDGQSTTQTDLSAVRVTLTSISGESVTETVSLTAGSCTEGSYQFSRGGSQSGPAPAPAPAPVASPTPTAAPVSAAPTPFPAPSLATPSPGATLAPTTTPSSGSQSQQRATDSTAANEAGIFDQLTNSTLPGSVRAADDSTMSSQEAESHVSQGQQQAADESGVLDSNADAAPSPAADGETTSSDASTTTTTTTPSAGGATEATTRSGADTSTSPAIIVLTVIGAVGVGALAVVAIFVRRKRIDDKNADRDDSLMVVNLRSFDTPENARGAASML